MQLAGVVEADVEALDDCALHAHVVEMQRSLYRFEAAQAKALARWEASGCWADNGSLSAAARYARDTGLSESDAKHLLLRARRLQKMPLTLALFAAGGISSSRVDLLVHSNQPRVSDLFSRDEAMLLDLVSTMSFSDAKSAAKHWMNCADAVGSESRAKRHLQQRSAYGARTFEGSFDMRALFDSVSGEWFEAEWDRLVNQLFEADWAEAREQYGDDVMVEHLRRTPAQRRCSTLR